MKQRHLLVLVLFMLSAMVAQAQTYEKLWKDVLDPFPIHLLRSFPDSTALSLRTVHYCCGYVSEPGNH